MGGHQAEKHNTQAVENRSGSPKGRKLEPVHPSQTETRQRRNQRADSYRRNGRTKVDSGNVARKIVIQAPAQ